MLYECKLAFAMEDITDKRALKRQCEREKNVAGEEVHARIHPALERAYQNAFAWLPLDTVAS